MTKAEFLNELKEKLKRLPQNEINNSISYYSEIIDEKIDAGMSEADAVASLGNIDDIAREILCDMSFVKIVKEKIKPKKSLAWWHIALIIIGFPIWFPLLAGFFSIIISIYAGAVSVAISLFAIVISTLGAGIFGIVAAAFMMTSNMAMALLILSMALFSLGFGLFAMIGVIEFTKILIKLTKWIIRSIKKAFIGKEKKENEEIV